MTNNDKISQIWVARARVVVIQLGRDKLIRKQRPHFGLFCVVSPVHYVLVKLPIYVCIYQGECHGCEQEFASTAGVYSRAN